jgi:DNA invertase Pin-like site-specific DNA recombinase
MSKAHVVGYVRVSTAEQAESRLGLEAQRAAIAAWADSRGLEVTIYEDAGITGTSMAKRPALEQALCAAKDGAVMVAYSLSRFARSTRDMLIIAERLKRQGADLVSLTESIDTTTATGRLVFTLLSALSQFERDLTSERTKAALGALKARGVKLGPKKANTTAAHEATRLRWARYRANLANAETKHWLRKPQVSNEVSEIEWRKRQLSTPPET